MRVVLLSLAALAAASTLAVPAQAQAQTHSASGFSNGHEEFVGDFRFGPRDGDRRDRRRDRGDVFLYPPDYQGDTAWKADGFNDWWHDQPHRSQPAWVRNNRHCGRQYWVGNTLRC